MAPRPPRAQPPPDWVILVALVVLGCMVTAGCLLLFGGTWSSGG